MSCSATISEVCNFCLFGKMVQHNSLFFSTATQVIDLEIAHVISFLNPASSRSGDRYIYIYIYNFVLLSTFLARTFIQHGVNAMRD